MLVAFTLKILLSFSAMNGPIIGDLTSSSVRIWVRGDSQRTMKLQLTDHDATHFTVTTEDTDNTTTFQLHGLKPNTKYEYTLNGEQRDSWWFKTLPTENVHVKIAFGSCADEK